LVDSGSFWDGSRKRNSYRSGNDNDYIDSTTILRNGYKPTACVRSVVMTLNWVGVFFDVFILCVSVLCVPILSLTLECVCFIFWGTLMEHHGSIYMGISLWALFGSLVISLLSRERVLDFCITSKTQVCYKSTNRKQRESLLFPPLLHLITSFIHNFL
jgi:hypothetical protein